MSAQGFAGVALTTALALGGCTLRGPSTVCPIGGLLYRHTAVAADHPVASEAGLEMLKRGGNAVDAAVATSFCLSVVRPYSCGIGGGGFMLIYIPSRDGQPAQSIALNYRETCPSAIGSDFYTNLSDTNANRYGANAVAVPGTVAGLCLALEKYGTLDLPAVLEPAIRAAEQGVPADRHYVQSAGELAKTLDKHPELRETAAFIWERLCLEGQVQVGDIITQPEQARTLRLLAEHGPNVFYRGEIAEAIASTVQQQGGALSEQDLPSYAPREVQPIRGTFRDYDILSMPPPSSGGIAVLQILGILERRWEDLPRNNPFNSQYVHMVVEAFKHAFTDRSRFLADPAFVAVPVNELLAPANLDDLASRIDPTRRFEPQAYGTQSGASAGGPSDGGTSHISVIDSSGMAVACTETINLIYGSLIAVPEYGIILNNEMDDFTTIPGQPNAFGLRQSEKNLPQPGKRPLSSMSPTIVLQGGKAVLIAGGSGGPRIISAVTQCILNCLLFDMDAQTAVEAPRLHHQWMPNALQFEKGWDDPNLKSDLEGRGHVVGELRDEAAVQLIRVTPSGIQAASDPRKGGRPAGY